MYRKEGGRKEEIESGKERERDTVVQHKGHANASQRRS